MPRKTDVPDKIRRLRDFYRAENRMPGYTEMLRIFNYKSKNAVHRLLLRLHQEGILIKEPSGKIAPTARLTGTIRMLGSVQAGFPTAPEADTQADLVKLDDLLVRQPDRTFMLKVTGQSMRDAGIYEGDMVLVERGGEPKAGDVVVAQVDGEWTLKTYRKSGGQVSLEPANPDFQTIVPRQSLTIGGTVKAVIRKYD